VNEPVYIGGFSGGIDSQAAARFMLNRYGAARVVLVNSDAGGNEHLRRHVEGCLRCRSMQ
jgi:PP-loop superfamily ATP-utilizing enzyme